jgi:NADH dehydrogenase [ubiquinone] 1 alpha subcomplex assembly factor 1
MSLLSTLLLPLLFLGATTISGADDADRALFDFAKPNAAQAWQPVNDGVMGGVSDGRFKITEQGTMEFFGALSLENNGGFASMRSRRGDLGLKPGDTLLIRLRGDGREYLLNLYAPSLQVAYSCRAAIPTKAGEWIDVRIPIKDCYARRSGASYPTLVPWMPRRSTRSASCSPTRRRDRSSWRSPG